MTWSGSHAGVCQGPNQPSAGSTVPILAPSVPHPPQWTCTPSRTLKGENSEYLHHLWEVRKQRVSFYLQVIFYHRDNALLLHPPRVTPESAGDKGMGRDHFY